MISRLFGLAVLVGGFLMMLLSFRADEYGFGRHGGVGQDQMWWTLISLVVQVCGALMLFHRSRAY